MDRVHSTIQHVRRQGRNLWETGVGHTNGNNSTHWHAQREQILGYEGEYLESRGEKNYLVLYKGSQLISGLLIFFFTATTTATTTLLVHLRNNWVGNRLQFLQLLVVLLFVR